jgi:hypothetical protein
MDIYVVSNRVDKRKTESSDPFLSLRMQNVEGANPRRKQIILDKADAAITDRNNGTILIKIQIDVITAAARMADGICRQFPQQKFDIVRVVARDAHSFEKTEGGTPEMGDVLHRFRQVKR